MLVDALIAAGIILQQQRNHTKKELQDFARNNGVDLLEYKELVVPGWEGKPKGLMQVLRERGLIDMSSLTQYTVDGKKNLTTGDINLHSSLCHILANRKDFQEEETALEHLSTQLGVTVKLTPKFHAKLAPGEGVEYCWAHSKSKVLTKVRIEKFAARARAYICSYHRLEHQKQQGAGARSQNSENRKEPKQQELLYSEIERLTKAFRGHQCALDFDQGFVHSALKQATTLKDDEGKW